MSVTVIVAAPVVARSGFPRRVPAAGRHVCVATGGAR